MKFTFEVTCVGSGDGEGIQAMVDTSHPITRRTFLTYVDPPSLRAVERSLGYPRHSKAGLTMAKDWHVDYARSTWRGRPCVYFTWSAIEHIFSLEGTP